MKWYPASTPEIITRVWSADVFASASELCHSTPPHITPPNKHVVNLKHGRERMFGMINCMPSHLVQLKPSHLAQLKRSYIEHFASGVGLSLFLFRPKLSRLFICSTNPPRRDRRLKKILLLWTTTTSRPKDTVRENVAASRWTCVGDIVLRGFAWAPLYCPCRGDFFVNFQVAEKKCSLLEYSTSLLPSHDHEEKVGGNVFCRFCVFGRRGIVAQGFSLQSQFHVFWSLRSLCGNVCLNHSRW